jgi:hypothetical protein
MVCILRLLSALLLASGRGCVQQVLDCTTPRRLVEGTEVFSLSGTLEKYVFPDDVYAAHGQITLFVMKLDHPQDVVCFSPEINEEQFVEEGIALMQLSVRGQCLWNLCESLVNKHVVVEGSLYHAHNGHHYTTILIDVERISLP